MAVVKTLPLDYDLSVYTGATFKREFKWLPDGTSGLDFTMWAASLYIGKPGARTPMLTLTNGAGITLTETGQIIVVISATQTAALEAGVLSYSLDLADAAGTVTRFLRGRLNVIADVGRQT